MTTQSVFVVGAGGFVGRALVARLAAMGHPITAPAREQFDTSQTLGEAFEGETYDVVINLVAARSRYSKGIARWPDDVDANVASAARVCDWARRRGVGSLVHLSSVSVFARGVDPRVLLDESSPVVRAPGDSYALSKLWGEELVRSFAPHFDNVFIARPGLVFGEGQSEAAHVARWMSAVQRGEERSIAAPDGDRLSPIFIDDVVDVLAQLVSSPRTGDANIVGDPASEREIASALQEVYGRPCRVALDSSRTPISFSFSRSRVDAMFPSRTRTPWRDALVELARR